MARTPDSKPEMQDFLTLEPYLISSGHHYVVIDVSHNTCAIALASVQEVLFYAELCIPPGMPPILAGILNYRGVPVPALRIAHLFELEAVSPALYTPLVVIRHSAGPLALLVDEVCEVTEAPAPMSIPQGHTFQDASTSAIMWRDEPIAVLEVERLLTLKETQCVSHFRTIEGRRLAEWMGVPS